MTRFNGDLSTLKALPLLSSLDDRDLAAALQAAQQRTYATETLITQPGTRVEGLYVILSGTVNLLIEDGQGREIVVGSLRTPEFFGESSLFSATPEFAGARAQRTCEILHLPRHTVLGWLEHNFASVLLIAQSLAARLAHAHRQIADLAFVDVYGRVARTLLERSREVDGEWSCDPSCAQLAARVGASREMVSRVIGDMTKKGTLRREKRRLVLLDRAALFARTLHGRRLGAGCD
jgi:CRP/FNR family transcriptional regulator, cyclic AMP receptor protein